MRFPALLCAALILPTSLPARADGEYVNHPRAKLLMERMITQHGFKREQILAVLEEAERIPALIPKETGNAEKVKPWYEYRKLFVHPHRIQQGVAFMREHAAALKRAEVEFGVPAEIIVGVIGVETAYGKITGNIRVLDALATQGFEHPTRAEFFFNELVSYLVLCRALGLDLEDIEGSYAGAMGMAQFMPSNYLTLALDYDKNGKLDLWDPDDAIGSIGNYLVHYRGPSFTWNRNVPVVFRASADAARLGALPRNTKQVSSPFKLLLDAGVRTRQDSTGVLLPTTPVGLLELEGRKAPEYWVALDNFYAIMSYNPRVKYAMAVYQLSQAVRKAHDPKS